MENITTISVKKTTKSKLEKIGRFGQSFDDIIGELLQQRDLQNV